MKKQFGIRITLPKSSAMRFDHLLGKDWESFRWYDNAEQRDHAFEDMMSQPRNYRDSDTISQRLEKVENK